MIDAIIVSLESADSGDLPLLKSSVRRLSSELMRASIQMFLTSNVNAVSDPQTQRLMDSVEFFFYSSMIVPLSL